jgi:two-component SAPR family response regulator
MLKAVLIDDERLALKGLEHMLKKYEIIQIAGMYTNPIQAIKEIGVIKPDVVFLDIEMPQLRGIDAASAILEAYSDLDIVFVTAYNQYAIEAFEINALDYLLKPVSDERLEKSIKRILARKNIKYKINEKQLHIRFFGGFQMFWEDHDCIKWRAEKTKELFLYLVQNRSRSISKYELLDQLWPDDDPSKSVKQLYNGIYYIRKNLKSYGIERKHVSIDSKYKLTLGDVIFDIEQFDALREKIDNLDINNTKKLIECMTGEYLNGYYYSWIELERIKYNRLLEFAALGLSKKFIRDNELKEAEEILLKYFEKNKSNEEIVSTLIQLYKKQNLFSNAQRIYNLYKKSMMEDFTLEPSKEIEKLIRK